MSARSGPRVLVPRPDHLGDLLLTLPAIRALRTRLPDAHIACMVPGNVTPLAERAVDVDEVVTMPFVLTEPVPRPASPVLAATAAALRGRFDLALLTRPNDPWSGAVTSAASVPRRVGHPQPGTLPFLTHAFPERPSRHVAREAVVLALRAAALLGPARRVARASHSPALALLPEDHRAAARVLSRAGGNATPPVIVHPTAGWPLKTWPARHWSRVVSDIGERLACAVLVAGQAADKPRLDEIVDGAGGEAHAVHDVSLGTLGALHASARVVVGIDSGALHLAALMGAPVVALFGPFGPGRVAPLAPSARSRALWHALPCSPCGTLETPPCGATREPACLLSISPDEVVDAATAVAAARTAVAGVRS